MVLSIGGTTFAQDVITISGTVTTRADGLPVPGATVAIVGAGATATADASGRYTLQVPRSMARDGRLRVRVDALGLPARVIDAAVNGATLTVDIALTIGFSEQVTVGSRAAGADAEKAVPVDVLTHDQIAASGFTETAQVIESLAPSFNFTRPSITDGTDTVRPATLRGLGPDQVLVLVNGKRRHQSALVHLNGSIGRGSTGVDLNAIPVSAIDHIEVLRDGAAAQYGSDAIAGVINLVLKGGVSRPAVTSNFGLSKGSFAGNNCTPNGQSCTEGSDIPFADGGLADLGGSWGIGVGKGSVTVASEYRHHNRTNRASFDPRDQIVAGDAGNNAVAEPNHRWGDPDTRDLMTFANANLPLNASETRSIYAFGGYSRRTANSAGFYRRALDARNWPQIYPLGFLPTIQPTVLDISGTGGVRGLAGGWTYDLSAGYGHNSFAFAIGDTLNVSLGPSQPPNKTTFDAGTLILNQFVGNADISRRIRTRGFAAPLNVAFGAEVRRENYQIQAGEPDSYRDGGVPNQAGGPAAIGAQVFPGFRPSNAVNESRASAAGYVDVEGDPSTWLRIGAAGRAERYSDFGGTIDGKLSARLQPDRRLVVRGSVSTGFRAPSLAQSFFSSTATNFLNLGQGLVPVEALTLPVASPAAQVLGAAPLRPESSRNASAGVVITPIGDLEVAVDYYHIAIDDRIVLSGNFTAAPVAELLAPFGANSARFFTNAIDTRTRGVDATATYRVSSIASGDLELRAGYNNTRTKIVGTIATPPSSPRTRQCCSTTSNRTVSNAASRTTTCAWAAGGGATGSVSMSTSRGTGVSAVSSPRTRPTTSTSARSGSPTPSFRTGAATTCWPRARRTCSTSSPIATRPSTRSTASRRFRASRRSGSTAGRCTCGSGGPSSGPPPPPGAIDRQRRADAEGLTGTRDSRAPVRALGEASVLPLAVPESHFMFVSRRSVFAAAALALSACSGHPASHGQAAPAPQVRSASSSNTPTLDAVRSRGFVRCGVSTGIAGFSSVDGQGQWQGLDVDICRAIAVAVLGDATKVRFTPLTSAQRFTALQAGEIDVLARSTTVTFQRDAQLGIEFPAVNWYDGTGFLVPKALGVKSARDLDGATICVQPGTTTELDIADYFRAHHLRFTPVVIERVEEATNAYYAGRCDAFSQDQSMLAGVRLRAPKPEEHVVLPEVISKAPIAPGVMPNDVRWMKIVRWAVFAMIDAEELGLDSTTIERSLTSSDPDVQRFVGTTGGFGAMLGVDPRWAYNIVKQVGSYGESFDRNIKPLGVGRGLNRLWKDGGILYAPDLR